MTRKENLEKSSWKSVIQKNMFPLIFTFFMANIGLLIAVRYYGKANQCFDKSTLSANSMCLYVYNGKVYEKGTHDAPHHGHPCGDDVTAVLPPSHLGALVTYLDPNYKGDICTVQPTTPPEPTSPPQPTDPPPPTDAPAPTEAPVPTDIPEPTDVPEVNTPTSAPSSTSRIIPTPTVIRQATNQCLVPPAVLNLHIDCPLCGN